MKLVTFYLAFHFLQSIMYLVFNKDQKDRKIERSKIPDITIILEPTNLIN